MQCSRIISTASCSTAEIMIVSYGVNSHTAKGCGTLKFTQHAWVPCRSRLLHGQLQPQDIIYILGVCACQE